MPDKVLARSGEGMDDFPYDSEHIEVESEIREYDLDDDEEGLPLPFAPAVEPVAVAPPVPMAPEAPPPAQPNRGLKLVYSRAEPLTAREARTAAPKKATSPKARSAAKVAKPVALKKAGAAKPRKTKRS